VNVKAPLLPTPFSITVTSPVVAAEGTVAMICVLLQLEIEVADTPLNLTELVPCVAPNANPLIVTDEPSPPYVGEIPVMMAEVPDVIETLSNVAVPSVEVLPLVTANPT
jgi:hypothetical protein